MKRLASIGLCAAIGCAAAGQRAPAIQEGTRVATPQKVEYERILGSFAATHDAVIYLDPALCVARCSDETEPELFEELVASFRLLDVPRGEAAARLNLGALLWRAGEPDRAYAQFRDAETRFALAGDAEGLAHAQEWLGFLFHQAGAIEEAGEHLAVAYQIYRKLEDQASAARVLGYADD